MQTHGKKHTDEVTERLGRTRAPKTGNLRHCGKSILVLYRHTGGVRARPVLLPPLASFLRSALPNRESVNC